VLFFLIWRYGLMGVQECFERPHLLRPMYAPRHAGAGGARGTRPISSGFCYGLSSAVLGSDQSPGSRLTSILTISEVAICEALFAKETTEGSGSNKGDRDKYRDYNHHISHRHSSVCCGSALL
jgi:hypothetical protein